MDLTRKFKIAKGKLQDAIQEILANTVFKYENQLFETEVPSIRRHITTLKQEANFIEFNFYYNYIKKKYAQSYLPLWIKHSHLNQRNKERYFLLRFEIDEVLERH